MEESPKSHSYVCVKVEHVDVIREKLKEIREKFSVCLREVPSKTKTECGSIDLSVLFFTVEKDDECSQIEISDTACRIQSYVDSLCGGRQRQPDELDRGDDSSYDSDVDGETDSHGHPDVSRTASETLAAEYADYVNEAEVGEAGAADSDADAELAARLEFGLRLGYSEQLVRTALGKLSCPTQNELLAELIRLGAQGQPQGQQCQPQGPGQGQGPGQPQGQGQRTPVRRAIVGPEREEERRLSLRPIVVDGSNVAMSHGNKEVFSCRGIRLCVDWFRARGHTDITVFVPKWRKESTRPDNIVTEQDILNDLERERVLVFTPSRLVGGKRLVCYDDRYILRLAADTDGVVVSNDNYRDLAQENPEFRRVVEERILMYSFVNDRFMPPDDPLGRAGPSLDQFLRVPAPRTDQLLPCPYAKKCTYGNKCKFSHPERGLMPQKSVTERLAEHAQRQLLAAGLASPGKQLKGKSLSLPLDSAPDSKTVRKATLVRTKSNVPCVSGAPIMQQPAVSKSFSVDSLGGLGVTAVSVAGGALPGYTVAPPDAANMHRKLQRQLTLNPAYDPRLLHMRRILSASGSSATSQGLSPPAAEHPHSGVARIASAPDSYSPWAPHQPPPYSSRTGSRSLGASEPQLNVAVSPQPQPQPQPHDWNQVLWNQQARRRLHFHLASIFPEDLVAAAMSLYPDEADPQKICGAILAMQAQQGQHMP